jgi:Domain of unknown function (DUF6532)
VDAHHKRNRQPSAPDSDQLNAIRKSYINTPLEDGSSESGREPEFAEIEVASDTDATTDSDDDDSSETESSSDAEAQHGSEHREHKGKGNRTRAPRNSKGRGQVTFTQLQAYPGQWRSVLEDAKRRNRCTATLKDGFPDRRAGLKKAEDSLAEAMAAHAEKKGVVEKGTCKLLMLRLRAEPIYMSGYYPEYKAEMKVLVSVQLPHIKLYSSACV